MTTWTPAEGIRRRNDAALRCEPLPTGHRDPDGSQTDAPDIALVNEILQGLDDEDWAEITSLQHAGASARQTQWAGTSAHVDEDRVRRTYDRARYLSQTRGLPWAECARIAREESAGDPPGPDPHDTFAHRFPDPVDEDEKARARRAAHAAAQALTHLTGEARR